MRITLHIGPESMGADRLQTVLSDKSENLLRHFQLNLLVINKFDHLN